MRIQVASLVCHSDSPQKGGEGKEEAASNRIIGSKARALPSRCSYGLRSPVLHFQEVLTSMQGCRDL